MKHRHALLCASLLLAACAKPEAPAPAPAARPASAPAASATPDAPAPTTPPADKSADIAPDAVKLDNLSQPLIVREKSPAPTGASTGSTPKK
ncbi:MAG: hypothetical protein HZA31_08710 [Opitutae bacterium]|nr:hypothetical protein [Opitutae bacterium]